MSKPGASTDQRDPDTHRRWAWRIGSLAGIGIYVHATFVLLVAWIAMSHLGAGHDVAMVGQGLLLVLSVFAIVVLHELGHALVARRFGIATHDITLYPIGGIARLERMPEKPAQELLVAIAGPAVNGVLALAIYVGLYIAGVGAGGNPLTVGGSFAIQLMWINISLGAFNLLPAFPMDGGRILRSVLGFWLDHARATEVSARVGRGLAVVMGVAGLAWSPMLAVIALFVWMAAGQEAAMERMKTTLRDVSVADAMVAEFQTLSPDTPLGTAAARLVTSFQHDFPVVEAGHVIGMLTRDDIVRGLTTRPANMPVTEVMHRDFAMAGIGEELSRVLGRLPPDGSSIIVFEHDEPVGLLDPEHVGGLLALRGALQRGTA
jgi:Zn-dependent protease/CBS domain-containing protein